MPNYEKENKIDSRDARRGKRIPQAALKLGPRKKPRSTDPLIHHGRHFGRSIYALCNVPALITNGIVRMASDDPDEDLTAQERRERKVFFELLKSVPGLEERLMSAESEDEIHAISTLIQKGASSARSDDTKSLKSAIIDWLMPLGEAPIPPIARNVKIKRGFNHNVTGALLCPTGIDWSDHQVQEKLRSGELLVSGDQWPIFLYRSYKFDSNNPWKGLLQSSILVKTYKHIFTSPSSVEREAKATRSRNACIHGMTRVTPASIAYAATQARFALSSSSVFSRTDTVTDSERFYNSVLELLEDPDETKEIDSLIAWWNCQVLPNYSTNSRPISEDSVLAKIKAKRATTKQQSLDNASSSMT
ncbi:hypothetical protein HYPSUDRAFT_151676 [Hypholoma sublateritium FD-334 SS-4]|uniref:Uncharacterized protein n=1 Tax=Hypholoma sublateritium (strain FD-334 SS-4) TaxID=945553 RepID=A0A0D2NXZ6_HYPSF|nr:hypothetical protein HYPSUDRAFT_151676 [Hypholoma sublateritium FD-334 SS-4]